MVEIESFWTAAGTEASTRSRVSRNSERERGHPFQFWDVEMWDTHRPDRPQKTTVILSGAKSKDLWLLLRLLSKQSCLKREEKFFVPSHP